MNMKLCLWFIFIIKIISVTNCQEIDEDKKPSLPEKELPEEHLPEEPSPEDTTKDENAEGPTILEPETTTSKELIDKKIINLTMEDINIVNIQDLNISDSARLKDDLYCLIYRGSNDKCIKFLFEGENLTLSYSAPHKVEIRWYHDVYFLCDESECRGDYKLNWEEEEDKAKVTLSLSNVTKKHSGYYAYDYKDECKCKPENKIVDIYVVVLSKLPDISVESETEPGCPEDYIKNGVIGGLVAIVIVELVVVIVMFIKNKGKETTFQRKSQDIYDAERLWPERANKTTYTKPNHQISRPMDFRTVSLELK